MPQNFLECDREQAFLMPPDPRDWLPEDHLAWFVLASVEQMDLSAFLAAYRSDGWGRAAFEPSMMASLLLYAYARGERSSRGIERKCTEDVAYRVTAAQIELDSEVIVPRIQGRDGWLLEARRQLDEHRRREAKPIARSRAERLLESERRLQLDLEVERAASVAADWAPSITSAYRMIGASGRQLSSPRTGPIGMGDPRRLMDFMRWSLDRGLPRPPGSRADAKHRPAALLSSRRAIPA
jgi:hypothetical protein